jgi:thioredoxin-related protein
MRILTIILICLIYCISDVSAQPGIHFEKATSWSDALVRAKKENKYIFLDCYTTWCAPCKFMNLKIFTQEQVGQYMNGNFICIKVQCDSTAKDSDSVRKWYADAHSIISKYNVKYYPTYLFFTPEGQVVHTSVGLTKTADEFLAKARSALNPDKQYYTLLEKFNTGEIDSLVLYNLILSALELQDTEIARKAGNRYFTIVKDRFNKKNLEVFKNTAAVSNDQTFAFLLSNLSRVIKIVNDPDNSYEQKIKNVLYHEVVDPIFQKKDTIINWNKISQQLHKKTPALADKIETEARINYYKWKLDWDNYSKYFLGYLNKYGESMQGYLLNNYIWDVLEHCNDPKMLEAFLPWSKRTFEVNGVSFSSGIDTYANILYKLGRKSEAIEYEKKALEIATAQNDADSRQVISETLEKMKRGERIWK